MVKTLLTYLGVVDDVEASLDQEAEEAEVAAAGDHAQDDAVEKARVATKEMVVKILIPTMTRIPSQVPNLMGRTHATLLSWMMDTMEVTTREPRSSVSPLLTGEPQLSGLPLHQTHPMPVGSEVAVSATNLKSVACVMGSDVWVSMALPPYTLCVDVSLLSNYRKRSLLVYPPWRLRLHPTRALAKTNLELNSSLRDELW
ncbi:hypothetical protein SEMRO_1745_G294910.1 [Seminavis robusta]|uniref:Uncharacterized protein n=1 Tax=Seminavis robusta TaxID=568900 RepID=A0A9N8HU22_9STRA|nr:hypothetical protein SEMRO_1745_G294910.1 [Seminavis robusta]|eukprot:Sro1745_g294910.1 n/a (200) ;mRNA; f:1401-2000